MIAKPIRTSTQLSTTYLIGRIGSCCFGGVDAGGAGTADAGWSLTTVAAAFGATGGTGLGADASACFGSADSGGCAG